MKFKATKPMRWLALMIAVLTISGCASAGAESMTQGGEQLSATQGRKVVIGVSAPERLPAVLLTARQLFAGQDGYQADQMTIVVGGEALKLLVKEGGLEENIAKTMKQGNLRIVACEMAMDKMGVQAAELLPGVETVKNGFIELARLHALGYDRI